MKRALTIALPAVLAVCGAAFLVVGTVMGQNGEVLRKAIRICLECIGIG